MVRHPFALLLVFALLHPALSAGQDRPLPYGLGTRDAIILPVSLGLTLLGESMSGVQPFTPAEVASLSPADVNAFDRVAAHSWSPDWADRSDLGRDALIAGAALLSFVPQLRDGSWGDAATLAGMFGEAYLLLRGTTYTVKRLVGRKRPYMHNDELSVDTRLALASAEGSDSFESFYSGHAAAAFALATFASTVYEGVHGGGTASRFVWGSTLSVATLTAFARVRAGMHYPSDVLVGAAVGVAIGSLVPRLHRTSPEVALATTVVPMGFVVRIPWRGP